MERVSDEWLERKRKEAEFLLEIGLLDDESEQATREALMVFTELAERREEERERQNYLKVLVATTDKICSEAVGHAKEIGGPVNWSRLRCSQASKVEHDDGEVEYCVTVRGAAPDSPALTLWILEHLEFMGYDNVDVETEW